MPAVSFHFVVFMTQLINCLITTALSREKEPPPYEMLLISDRAESEDRESVKAESQDDVIDPWIPDSMINDPLECAIEMDKYLRPVVQ